MSTQRSQDQGWGRPRDIALALVAPQIAGRRQQTMLSWLRTIFLAFSMALALVSVVVVFVLDNGAEPENALDPTVAAGAVFAVGLGLHVASRLFSRRLARFHSCGSAAELAVRFRSLFFMQVAFAEISALVGFVTFFLTGSVIPYWVGLAWTAVGFIRIAPTRRHLERLQDEIALQGCPHQLLAALQSPAPSQEPRS